jgi:hypothetical protein
MEFSGTLLVAQSHDPNATGQLGAVGFAAAKRHRPSMAVRMRIWVQPCRFTATRPRRRLQ